MSENPADTIRRAAQLMRERAEDVPHGPWHFEVSSEGGYPQRVSNPEAILIAETYTGPGAPLSCAEYIAPWHPRTALAIAELFEAIADPAESYDAHESGSLVTSQYPVGSWLPTIWTAALAVARAYLGEPTPTEAPLMPGPPPSPCGTCGQWVRPCWCDRPAGSGGGAALGFVPLGHLDRDHRGNSLAAVGQVGHPVVVPSILDHLGELIARLVNRQLGGRGRSLGHVVSVHDVDEFHERGHVYLL